MRLILPFGLAIALSYAAVQVLCTVNYPLNFGEPTDPKPWIAVSLGLGAALIAALAWSDR